MEESPAPPGDDAGSTASAHTGGVLFPARLPTFHREPVTGELAAYVRWFWISHWNIAPGRTSRQHIIGYPASNLVVSHDRSELAGPTTHASHRDLSGSGWAVGALLQPAAIPGILNRIHHPDIAALRDTVTTVPLPDLNTALHDAMQASAPREERQTRATRAFSAWLTDLLGPPTAGGLLANRMVEAAESQQHILTTASLAAHLHVSMRTLQRLSATHVGLSPGALIRRRRLQDSARRLREQPDLSLSTLAHELGYTDHAHLTRDWRATLGFTPSGYRRGSRPGDATDSTPDTAP